MAKLTDTQLVILTAAAKRQDGAVLPLPRSLKIKGDAVTKTLDTLRKKGLLEEKPASRGAAAWREDKDGRCMMLFIAGAGLHAIEGAPAGQPPKQSTAAKGRAKQPRSTPKTAGCKPKDQESAPKARQGTKQALLIDLLKRKNGATIDEIVDATGWQPHSVRGAISGAIKKKLGLPVTSEKVEGRGRVYHIAGHG